MIQDGGHLRKDSRRMGWEEPNSWMEGIVKVLAILLDRGFMGTYFAVKIY